MLDRVRHGRARAGGRRARRRTRAAARCSRRWPRRSAPRRRARGLPRLQLARGAAGAAAGPVGLMGPGTLTGLGPLAARAGRPDPLGRHRHGDRVDRLHGGRRSRRANARRRRSRPRSARSGSGAMPPGVSTAASAPCSRPSSAAATGDSEDSLPWLRSASVGPTIVHVCTLSVVEVAHLGGRSEAEACRAPRRAPRPPRCAGARAAAGSLSRDAPGPPWRCGTRRSPSGRRASAPPRSAAPFPGAPSSPAPAARP